MNNPDTTPKPNTAEQPSPEGLDETTCCASSAEEYRHPQEWQYALDSLYVQYAAEPTPAQRIKILEAALGFNSPGVSYCIESTADWRIPKEDVELRNMRCLELDYLEQIGLHKPTFC
jgi:hypothetical protein